MDELEVPDEAVPASPVDAIPGYETDLSAIGTNRSVDPAAVDDRPWYEVHGLTVTQALRLLDEARA